MSEILNVVELTSLISSVPVMPGHAGLLAALRARYPDMAVNLVAEWEGRTYTGGIVDSAGQWISRDLMAWVDQELAEAQGNVQDVWTRYKDVGYQRTENIGTSLKIAIPYGTEPDAFYQLEVFAGAEKTFSLLFDFSPHFPPEDRFDLISGPSFVYGDSDQQQLSPLVYSFERLQNIRQFLRGLAESERQIKAAKLPAMREKTVHVQNIILGTDKCESHNEDVPYLDIDPGWFTRVPPALRLFQDWKESSAGLSGELLCNHWWVAVHKYSENDVQKYSLTPQWAEADGGVELPVISPDWAADPFTVMGKLSEFDRLTSYPFSWYFYLLHGNRVHHSAGSVVAKAILAGKMKPLPECDERVLLRWENAHYGF